MINTHRQFLYHKDKGAKIFDAGEEVDSEWVDTPDKFNQVVEQVAEKEDIEPAQDKKYPSQMNKAELIDFGKSIGLELDESMHKIKMMALINEKITKE